ncbi:MAG TPA: hypothetical protein VHB02_06240 [Acidimicrobiales bacterium]|nr:hypothetical protein [Acidimicrobiales bacterium]
MTASEQKAWHEQLREDFSRESVGLLPRVTCRACSDSRERHCDRHERSKCPDCGNFISTAHIHLDYVGHAAVTDRLLTVDPAWNWEPMATDEQGLPAFDRQGNLWVRLTVHGVTRLGVGDGKTPKEAIGDAIRNAAMRFGVALSLWSKDELESGHGEEKATDQLNGNGNGQNGNGSRRAEHGTVRQSPSRRAPESAAENMDRQAGENTGKGDDPAPTREVNGLRRIFAGEHGITDEAEMCVVAAAHLKGKQVANLGALSIAEIKTVKAALRNLADRDSQQPPAGEPTQQDVEEPRDRYALRPGEEPF